MAKVATVDEYIRAVPGARRAEFQQMRAAINAAVPYAVEVIAYDMPALRADGHFPVSYAAFKAHTSLFPASEAVVAALGEELAPYLAAKGTIRFPAKAPLPLLLITRIIRTRVREEREARAAK
ncbi:MAG: DUF1801 domain-containing protein [Chloroflexi bacterium]|nr:DUF1801 domain-containing protein [Chloroflexota bacterium]